MKLPVAEIYAFVVAECRNGCTTPEATFDYIKRHRPGWFDTDRVVHGYALGNFLSTLNFAAIRESSDVLYEVTHE